MLELLGVYLPYISPISPQVLELLGEALGDGSAYRCRFSQAGTTQRAAAAAAAAEAAAATTAAAAATTAAAAATAAANTNTNTNTTFNRFMSRSV